MRSGFLSRHGFSPGSSTPCFQGLNLVAYEYSVNWNYDLKGGTVTDDTPSAGAWEEPDTRVVGSDRVLAVLSELARHPNGIGLDDISKRLGSAKPTVHRALASLRKAGFASLDGHGHYILGDEFLRIAFAHHEARPDHLRVHPVLERLANRYRETSHYAILDGDSVVYRSKVDPSVGAVKLTSTVGGRNPAHCTAVGKLLLAYALPDEAALQEWIGDRTLERRTERSVTDPKALHAELEETRQRGYAVEDRENESGINCLALPAFLNSPQRPSGAISISALTYRTPLADLVADIDEIRRIVAGQA